MKDLFYGRIKVESATALLKFHKKGITQELLHDLKYRRQQKISIFLGRWLGAELSEIQEFAQVDAVVPVPMHPQKLRKRGYNQVTGFGKEIAQALNKPFLGKALIKQTKTASQVFKDRLDRFDREELFKASQPDSLQHKHLLLVDDVLTTGATLELCARAILNCGDTKVSLATMAIAE